MNLDCEFGLSSISISSSSLRAEESRAYLVGVDGCAYILAIDHTMSSKSPSNHGHGEIFQLLSKHDQFPLLAPLAMQLAK